MSLLRPSIAGRLLRATGPTGLRSIPNGVRCESGVPLTPTNMPNPKRKEGESSMINHPQSKDTLVKHNQPDYGVEVDQAASWVFHGECKGKLYNGRKNGYWWETGRLFTPIPKRVMNGSEEGDVLPAAVLSGAPIELQARTVRYVHNQLQALHNDRTNV